MFTKNKIKSKSLGAVRIFEICGSFAGEFASSGKAAMQKVMKQHSRKNVFLNLRDLEQIDEYGVDGLISNIGTIEKCALLASDAEIKEKIKAKDAEARISLLDNETQVTSFFSGEFASSVYGDKAICEDRKYIRLNTVLPVELEYESNTGAKEFVYAVVTNLSEGGFYAEFIESTSEDKAKGIIDPYDLKLIRLKVDLLSDGTIEAKGKLIHGSVLEGGLGIEFYGLAELDSIRIQDWVAKHLQANSKLWQN